MGQSKLKVHRRHFLTVLSHLLVPLVLLVGKNLLDLFVLDPLLLFKYLVLMFELVPFDPQFFLLSVESSLHLLLFFLKNDLKIILLLLKFKPFVPPGQGNFRLTDNALLSLLSVRLLYRLLVLNNSIVVPLNLLVELLQ